MSKNKKQTSEEIAAKASEALRDPKSSQIAKELAGSALAQTNTKKETGKTMEEKAAKVLSSKKYSSSTKKLAASVVSQSNKQR